MIIETTAGQHFAVTETGVIDLAHVWNGVEVKRVKGAWVAKKPARPILVRKTGARLVASDARVWPVEPEA